MPRRWRIILTFILILVFIAFTGIIYVNNVFLPTYVHGWAEKKLSETCGRRVTIGQIHLHVWHGIILDNVAVAEDARYGKEPFLTVKHISGKILYIPIFKNHEFIIPSLHFVNPHLRLLQETPDTWNFQSVLMPPSPASRPSRWKVAVPHIVISNGELETSFKMHNAKVGMHFEHVQAHFHFSLPARIQWAIEGQLYSIPSSHFKINGNYDHSTRQFQKQSEILLDAATLMHTIPSQWNAAISKLQGTFDIKTQAHGKLQGPWDIQGTCQTKGLAWQAGSFLAGQGDLLLRLNGHNLLPHNNLLDSMQAICELQKVSIQPIPHVGELKEMTGEILLDKTGIRTREIQAFIPSGEKLLIQGEIRNDEAKNFTVQIGTAIHLDHLPPSLKKISTTIAPWKPSGQTAVQLSAQGHMAPAFRMVNPQAVFTLSEGIALTFPFGGSEPAQIQSGFIRWKPDFLTATDITGKFQNQPFRIEGSLVNFEEPEIDGQLSWGQLSIDTKLSIEENRLEIQALSGHYGPAVFHLLGDIQDWKNPTANLYGETNCSIEALPSLVPNSPAWLKEIKGELSTRWVFQSPLFHPDQGVTRIKAESPQLMWHEIPFKEFFMDVRREEGIFSIESCRGAVAGGTISMTGSLSSGTDPSMWTAELTGENIDLGDLSRQLKWHTQDLNGRLSLGWKGHGKGSDLAFVEGAGSLQIKGARILEVPFLGRFAELLQIPTLRSIAFQEAQGPFNIIQGRVKSESLQIRSPQVTLLIIGSGGFLQGADSPIEWRVLPTLISQLIPEESLAKITGTIARGASYFVGEARISGTWRNPKHKFIPKPFVQILNEQMFNIQDLLKKLL